MSVHEIQSFVKASLSQKSNTKMQCVDSLKQPDLFKKI